MLFSKIFGGNVAPKAKKTVGDVIGVFSKAIADLEEVVTEQSAEADYQLKVAERANAATAEALSEVANAKSVIAKMSDIFKPVETTTV